MKKRKLSILICCLLGFTLISCSSDGSENKNNVNDTSKVQESKTPEESKTVEEDKTIKESKTVETNEEEVYKYLDSLLKSEENPSLREKIGNEDFEFNSEEWNNATQAWNEECEAYEKECVNKTAEKFNITTDEVNKIYYKWVTK